MPLRLVTDRCHVLDDPWADGALPLRFESLAESIEGILGDIRSATGIAAVGDKAVPAAAEIAARLGLPFHTIAGAAASRDKFLSRNRFAEAGLAVPGYQLISAFSEYRGGYPCVLKPLGLSGSRGVIRADTPAEFAAAFERISRLPGQGRILAEDFIPGREFAVEGIVTHGRLRVLAIFDKPDPLDGPFFEETIYVTPSREPDAAKEAMAEAVQTAVTALALTHGPIHAELRWNGGPWMLEVAGRPIGGLCARVLRFDSGRTLEEVILRHASGEDVAGERAGQPAGVMMIPIGEGGVYRGVSGVAEAKSVAGIEDVEITAAEGQHMIPLPEGSSYLGFIFARGGNPEAALREAHGRLRFDFRKALAVL